MQNKFPTNWASLMGESPYIDDVLTATAAEWSTQLASLAPDEIGKGLKLLSTREEKRFPPNAMEFRDLCTGSELQCVTRELMKCLEEGGSFKFTNQLAFNFWARYSFQLRHVDNRGIEKLIRKNIKLIDRATMILLPDYDQLALEEKSPEPVSQAVIKAGIALLRSGLS